ncbi:hypothetical protein ACVWZM_004562 [Bradyrhizobium sp. USDA 4501]
MPRSSASKKSVAAGERDRPEVARRRAQRAKYQSRVEAERLVLIERPGRRPIWPPCRGRASRGRRLRANVPSWKTMTFLAALRHDRTDSPWFIEGPIDGESFRTYVEKVLPPTLRPGDIVVMNIPADIKARSCGDPLRRSQAALPAQILTRPEPVSSGRPSRESVDTVCAAIGEVPTAFTSEECANYLKTPVIKPSAMTL